MAKRPLAAVLGDINRDLFVRVRHFPRPGSDNPALGSTWALGGSAANTAVALARLDVWASVIGRIGCDAEGRALLKELARSGVHTGAVQKDPSRATGICIVTVTADGERTLIGMRGANCALQRDGVAEAVASVRHLHVSGYALIQPESRRAAILALETARKAGAVTSLDFGWEPATSAPELLRQALRHVSLALPSAQELRMALGERRLSQAASKARAMGVEHVAVTLGAGGCRVFSENGTFRVPRFESRTINTCGAGDAFNAGYILGTLEGASAEACAILGNAAGAAVVESDSSHKTVTRDRLVKTILRAKDDPQLEPFAVAVGDAIKLLSAKSKKGGSKTQ
ncbi:MAG TPA: carbohydrate kinase family protein [Vicinamibacteria bacterium]